MTLIFPRNDSLKCNPQHHSFPFNFYTPALCVWYKKLIFEKFLTTYFCRSNGMIAIIIIIITCVIQFSTGCGLNNPHWCAFCYTVVSKKYAGLKLASDENSAKTVSAYRYKEKWNHGTFLYFIFNMCDNKKGLRPYLALMHKFTIGIKHKEYDAI